ncbi:MAG: DinB family protein [Gemmatimonadota bacterium]
MDEDVRGRPTEAEFDPYYRRYIDRITGRDILSTLRSQRAEIANFVSRLSPAIADHRYAPRKWTTRQVLNHVCDTERIFAARALCVARGETGPLPGFDENAYAAASEADRRPLADLGRELDMLRGATIGMLSAFDDAAWRRVGTANGSPVSVRAIAWILAGHADHHLHVIRERYLQANA